MVESRWRGGWALLACLAACQPGHGADPAAQKGTPIARPDSSNSSPTPMPSTGTNTGTSTGTNAAPKSGTGQLRTDAEPLLKRFPLLGRPLALQWMSGTLGDSRVPGPSTYWIDAIVDLPPEHAAWLRQNYGLPAAASAAAVAEPAAAAIPNLTPALQALLAPGPWQSSRELNTALSQQGFLVRAYLQADRLVLVALGQ